MNAIMVILVATGGLTIPSLPGGTDTYRVVLRNKVTFYGYEIGRKEDARLGEIVEYRYDEPFKDGTEVVRGTQNPETTKETSTRRQSRWKEQFEANGYKEVELPGGGKEFFPRTELEFAELARDAAHAVADANPPPPPLPEEPESDGSVEELPAEVNRPGFIRLWGPEIFVFVLAVAIIGYLAQTFLMRPAGE